MRTGAAAVARVLCALVALVMVASIAGSIGHAGSSPTTSSPQTVRAPNADSGVARPGPQAFDRTHLASLPASHTLGSSGIDPYDWYSSEPAPMGIADYGVTSAGSGAYSYSTEAVRGVVTFDQSAEVNNASLGSASGWFGTQLNVMLVFSNGGTQFVYWVQDVALYNTSSGDMLGFLDNIWNDSTTGSQMYNSTVSGNGTVDSNPAGGFYNDVASASLPGSQGTPLGVGSSFTLEMDAVESNDGQVVVLFQFATGSGEWVYDAVEFPWTTSVSDYYGFVVSGASPDPIDHPYDLELTFGGPGGGSQTADVASNLKYQLLYFNGNNFQSPENAFNFGDQTAEGSMDVQDYSEYNARSGNLTAHLVEGTGTDAVLGQLYTFSQVGLLNFTDPSANGSLTVNGVATPFYSGAAFVVLFPGTYDVNVTVAGTTTDLGSCALKAGVPLDVSPSSPCPGGSSGSTSGTTPNFLLGTFASIPVYLWLVIVIVVVVAIALVAVRSSRRSRPATGAPAGGNPPSPTGLTPWQGAAVVPAQAPPVGGSPPTSGYPGTYAPPVAATPWVAAPVPVTAVTPVPDRYCPRCGAVTSGSSVFCPRCGLDLTAGLPAGGSPSPPSGPPATYVASPPPVAATPPVAPTPVAAAAPPPMVAPPRPAPVAAPAVPFCNNCGRPTTYVAQYGRYYCYPCSRYV